MLPAGLIRNDLNIELFADPKSFGKCMFLQDGSTKKFNELSHDKVAILHKECFLDKAALKGLKQMNTPIENYVEQYNYCNRGVFDFIADISTNGTTTKEYFDCGRRGKCAGEGLVCKVSLNGVRITPRELQCLKLNSQGKSYEQIKVDMGFRSKTAVNSIMTRLREKLDAPSRAILAVKAKSFGIA